MRGWVQHKVIDKISDFFIDEGRGPGHGVVGVGVLGFVTGALGVRGHGFEFDFVPVPADFLIRGHGEGVFLFGLRGDGHEFSVDFL